MKNVVIYWTVISIIRRFSATHLAHWILSPSPLVVNHGLDISFFHPLLPSIRHPSSSVSRPFTLTEYFITLLSPLDPPAHSRSFLPTFPSSRYCFRYPPLLPAIEGLNVCSCPHLLPNGRPHCNPSPSHLFNSSPPFIPHLTR